MRLPDTEHTARPWRIHELAADFELEDVWALLVPGGPDDFARLVRLIASGGGGSTLSASPVVRTLFAIRWKLGAVLGWDKPDAGIGARVPTLRDRLPADLRDAPRGPDGAGPFRSVYLTDDEWVAETANRTVHAVRHIGWVPDQDGGYRGQMAVLVKPNGPLGKAYLAGIAPFRHLLVYPPLLRAIGRRWQTRAADEPMAGSLRNRSAERDRSTRAQRRDSPPLRRRRRAWPGSSPGRGPIDRRGSARW